MELGTHAQASFPRPQFAINGCRNGLTHLLAYQGLCLFRHSDLSMKRTARKKRNFTEWVSSASSPTAPEQLSLCTAVATYRIRTTNSSCVPVNHHHGDISIIIIKSGVNTETDFTKCFTVQDETFKLDKAR